MAQEPSSVEQAVARAMRDNLATLQRASEELQQALSDLSAACSSSRPTNALPPTLRAQTAAAALAASLEVLARFITGSLQAMGRVAVEFTPVGAGVPLVGTAAVQTPGDAGREMGSEGGPVPMPHPAVAIPPVVPPPMEAAPPVAEEPAPAPVAPPPPPEPAPVEEAAAFDVRSLSPQEQELHRRANRVAKVSMQDIKMLRPEDVKHGREKKDLCHRLRVDLDKARKEYDRRFRAILHHPVDYFYDWMVDILADGDPKALGEYPYPTSASRR